MCFHGPSKQVGCEGVFGKTKLHCFCRRIGYKTDPLKTSADLYTSHMSSGAVLVMLEDSLVIVFET